MCWTWLLGSLLQLPRSFCMPEEQQAAQAEGHVQRHMSSVLAGCNDDAMRKWANARRAAHHMIYTKHHFRFLNDLLGVSCLEISPKRKVMDRAIGHPATSYAGMHLANDVACLKQLKPDLQLPGSPIMLLRASTFWFRFAGPESGLYNRHGFARDMSQCFTYQEGHPSRPYQSLLMQCNSLLTVDTAVTWRAKAPNRSSVARLRCCSPEYTSRMDTMSSGRLTAIRCRS